MGYYIRILSPSECVPSVARIKAALSEANLAGTLTVEAGGDDNWTELVLAHEGGREIADIERNCTSSSDLVAGEIEEFLEEIADCQPASAATWLAEYLPTVKTIYAFQLLSGWQRQGLDLHASWRHPSGRRGRFLGREGLSHPVAVLELGKGTLVDGSFEGRHVAALPNGSGQQEAQGSLLAGQCSGRC
ncbi:MAG TPA: hypothetical protein VG826_28760 [Pirellulales bacterium]|nr:hypothetical protein [Pirellulales bacterium]